MTQYIRRPTPINAVQLTEAMLTDTSLLPDWVLRRHVHVGPLVSYNPLLVLWVRKYEFIITPQLIITVGAWIVQNGNELLVYGDDDFKRWYEEYRT